MNSLRAEAIAAADANFRPSRLLLWAGVGALGLGLMYLTVFLGGPAPLPRPSLIIGFVLAGVGFANVVGAIGGRHVYVLPDPGGRLWA